MAIDEDSILTQAIIDTEKEIAAEVWGEDEIVTDADGDHSLETMGEGLEGQHEPEEGAESEEDTETETDEEGETEDKPKPEKEGEGEDKVDDKAKPTEAEPQGRVPSGKLREANERARAAEAERDAFKVKLAELEGNSKRELDALNAKFDGVLAAMRQGQPARPADAAAVTQPEPPDIFDDPKGFAEYLQQGFRSELSKRDQQLEAMRVETSMGLAHARHEDVFVKAFDALQKLNPQNTDDRAVVQRIYGAANPGEALVAWHKRNEALREVGDDPQKYRERIAAETRATLVNDPEFRKQLLESLRAEAGAADHGRPNNVTRLPKSLNGAVGGNAIREDLVTDDSDQAIAASAWR